MNIVIERLCSFVGIKMLSFGDYSVLLVTLYGGAAYYKQLMLMFTTCREW